MAIKKTIKLKLKIKPAKVKATKVIKAAKVVVVNDDDDDIEIVPVKKSKCKGIVKVTNPNAIKVIDRNDHITKIETLLVGYKIGDLHPISMLNQIKEIVGVVNGDTLIPASASILDISDKDMETFKRVLAFLRAKIC